MSGIYRGVNGSAFADALNIDGDKGDITVSNSGTTWTIDNGAVTSNKILSVDATKVTNTPSGSLAATDVQAALNELQSDIDSRVAKTSSTGSAVLPSGTTAQRDGAPVIGYTRENSSTGALEYYNGSNWVDSGSVQTGNLAFTGLGQRITGDFNNATLANRLMFQNSNANAGSSVGVMPNGTGANSAYIVFAGSDVANTSFAQLRAGTDTADVRINSGAIGTGTYLPMTFYTGGSERMRIDTSGNVQQTTSANAVISNAIINTNAGSSAAALFSTTSNGGILQFARYSVAAGNVATIFNSGGGLFIGTVDANILNIRTNNTDHVQVDSTGNVLKISATGGLGYGTGAGGTVTQATSKSTAVTLNKPTGEITMNNAALSAATTVFFNVNNSIVVANDTVAVSVVNNANYTAQQYFGVGGQFGIRVTNHTAGSLSEAVKIQFAIIKGATT